MLFYDQDCGICTRAVSVVRRLDKEERIDIAPIRSRTGDALLGDLPDQVRDGSWHLVFPDGRRASEGRGLPALMSAIPRLAPFAPLVRLVRSSVRDCAYRAFARRRHRISRLIGAPDCRVGRDRTSG